jgi:hypothetical protein
MLKQLLILAVFLSINGTACFGAAVGDLFDISLQAISGSPQVATLVEARDQEFSDISIRPFGITIGTSALQNADERIDRIEETFSVDNNTTRYQIDLLGRRPGDVPTNWIGDGSVDGFGSPFQQIQVQLGILSGFNGLNPEFQPTPGFGGEFVVDNASMAILTTGGEVLGQNLIRIDDGDIPIPFNVEAPFNEIRGFGRFDFGEDIASANLFFGQEFSGIRLNFEVTAVPEPSGTLVILLSAGTVGLVHRRRRPSDK